LQKKAKLNGNSATVLSIQRYNNRNNLLILFNYYLQSQQVYIVGFVARNFSMQAVLGASIW